MLAAAGAAPPLAAQEPPDSVVTLPPIEVSVLRGAAPLGRLPFAVTSLRDVRPVADLGLSLSSALAAVPGVAVQARGNASRDESLVIRGFGARAAFGVRGIRVLLDGIPQTMPDGQSQLTLVNLRRIGAIEVMRGTGSALHGNATGGVVSLRSDRRLPAAVEADGRMAAGGYGLVSAEVGARMPLGSGVADVAAQHDRATGYRAQSRYEVSRVHLGMRGAIGAAGSIGWVVDAASYPVAQDPGGLTAGEVAADPRQASRRWAEVDAGKDVWQAQTGLTFDRPVGAGGRLEAAAFVTRRDLINRLPFVHIDLDRWAFGGRLETSIPLDRAGQAMLVAGGDLQQMRDDRVNRTADAVTVTRDQLETVREIGPFAQVRYLTGERVALLAGVRFDAVTFGVTDRLPADGDASGARTLSAPSGTFGLSVRVARPLVAWGRVGTAFETPTTTELANRPDGGGGFNPALEPQHVLEGELGLRVAAGPVQAGAAVFHAAVRDELVAFEVPSDPGRAYFRNAGRARHRGLELDARYDGGGPWVAAAYTLSDFRFVDYATDAERFDGNRVPGVPLHLGRLATGIHAGPASLEGEVRAASRVFADDANAAAADGWWVADVRAEAEVGLGSWRLRPAVGVENVFDRRYVAAVVVNAAAGRYYEPAAGRTAYVALSVRAARP